MKKSNKQKGLPSLTLARFEAKPSRQMHDTTEVCSRFLAEGCGFGVEKSPTQSKKDPEWKTFRIVKLSTGEVVHSGRPGGYGLNHDQIEAYVVREILGIGKAQPKNSSTSTGADVPVPTGGVKSAQPAKTEARKETVDSNAAKVDKPYISAQHYRPPAIVCVDGTYFLPQSTAEFGWERWTPFFRPRNAEFKLGFEVLLGLGFLGFTALRSHHYT